MSKKYTGKEPNKILYQKTIDTIENNIKYKIKNLRFGMIKNMQYYPALEVIKIIDYAVDGLEDQKIKEKIEANIKHKIEDLKFLAVENTQYYSDHEVIRIIDNTINDLVRKIYF
jgi:hypothetical protein